MQECLETPIDTLTRIRETAHKCVTERYNVDTQAGKFATLFQAAVESANT
jgi:hypothetical protein